MPLITNFITSFVLGLLTPLTAVCIIPLYPGFLAYLANQFSVKTPRRQYALFGLLITVGVIIFMLLLGLIFTTLLQQSLTKIIGIVSPIAFIILAIIGLLLIFDVDFSKAFPKMQAPITKNPYKTALLYGFFFGAIVIPCNPAFIGAFFARALLITDPLSSILNFIFFGIGIGFPLLAFSLISAQWSTQIISWITARKRGINLIAGILMLLIALYYLFFVFKIFG